MLDPSKISSTGLRDVLERALNVHPLDGMKRFRGYPDILYGLGHGPESVLSQEPCDKARLCDCSAFVCWCNMMPKNDNGVWHNTDEMVADATGNAKYFVHLSAPIPGCTVVYPHNSREQVGHCGIVTEVNHTTNGMNIRGVDCHGGPRGHHVQAIDEEDLSYFLKAPGVCFIAPRKYVSEDIH